MKGIIALDCDGVLLDTHSAFAQLYTKTFGKELAIVSPKSYSAKKLYGVEFTPEEHNQFKTAHEAEGWRMMPPLDGALEACLMLHNAGYELVCVTAMPGRFLNDRLENFRLHGFPIDKVISTGYDPIDPTNNPKKQTIEALKPVVFVDDLRRNLKDIEGEHTKLVFIDHGCHDEPYHNGDVHYDAKYPTLLEFSIDFLAEDNRIVWIQRPAISTG
ncbi:unnamed protein product [Rotaria sordida]|uniref:Uncharacterized protein n=1 Tax=Rotaria sordida TaxID=392033 RepID=A0A814CEG6_9BILA|nr:unnamed protein product [Rotaria sordida]CAF1082813.1 unnamed protein product [Rotaria sordida]